MFSLYLDGLSYQRISDTLNGEEIPFCREAPVWNKHKVKRLLENPRYAGRDGYPPILEDGVFRETQSHIRGKTAGYAPRAERPALRLKENLRCAECGASLHRLAERTAGRTPCISSAEDAAPRSRSRTRLCWKKSPAKWRSMALPARRLISLLEK